MSDYEEYQRLKEQNNKIDYSKLKTGSVVKLNLDKGVDLTASTCHDYNKNNEYTLVLIDSHIQVSSNGVYNVLTSNYTTAVDDKGVFIHIIDLNITHISKVISY